MKKCLFTLCLLFTFFFSCEDNSNHNISQNKNDSAYTHKISIKDDSFPVDVVIDKPIGTEFDVILLFHGTVTYDSLILNAAYNTLDGFKGILERKDIMLVSVAYPEENLLFGDNIKFAETALLWLKNKASLELNVKIKKIFMAGHSQGGYLVTRLNTMHQTDGVIANAPGPLNLIFRCQLEEEGKIQKGVVCNLLKNKFGTTSINPEAYKLRSLLNYTADFKSDILFVQGLDDSPIQMNSWPLFKEKVTNCANCKDVKIFEVDGYGHQSLFESKEAALAFNQFISER